MPAYILTGTPGSGKTAILRQLLQRLRFARTAADRTIFFDRSPVCTLALCRHLGLPASHLLVDQVTRARHVYERTVLFVRNQGFVESTAARRISFEDSLAFERFHEQTYRELGFTLVDIPAGPLPDRVAAIRRSLKI